MSRMSFGEKLRSAVTVPGTVFSAGSTWRGNSREHRLTPWANDPLLDPHGDLVDEVVRRCPEKRIQDVVLVDPADAEYPIGFNILQLNRISIRPPNAHPPDTRRSTQTERMGTSVLDSK